MEQGVCNKIRKSNFELLRIVSILFIISHHYILHGGALNIESSINKIVAQFFYIGGKLGVNCFVLLSGYFLTDLDFKI